ncbi:hypothetical protein ACWC09_23825 [Streptomyces sp. NPDC001617]
MARYRALLIGVAQYEAPGISSLPFVPADLELMATALSKRGYHQVRLVQSPWFTPNVINGEVAGLLSGAERGDRLLIVLSGPSSSSVAVREKRLKDSWGPVPTSQPGRTLSVSLTKRATSARVRVAANLVNIPVATLRSSLREVSRKGYPREDPAYDELLIRSFNAPDTRADGPAKQRRNRSVRLAEIAAAALMVQRPFREVAARATELGLRHEAEDWWAQDRKSK